MAYGNNNDTKNLSAVWVEKKNREGKPSKYFSFTFEVGGNMYTCRVYAGSTYTPESGKHQGKICCPARVTKWTKSTSPMNKW